MFPLMPSILLKNEAGFIFIMPLLNIFCLVDHHNDFVFPSGGLSGVRHVMLMVNTKMLTTYGRYWAFSIL